jgi:hypothetical protein
MRAQEFLRLNINTIIPEPCATFHDEVLLQYNATGLGPIVNMQRLVFGIKRSGHVFPMAIFVRGGADGISVVVVMEPITARDDVILCSGPEHLLSGLSEGSARELGARAAWRRRGMHLCAHFRLRVPVPCP